MKHLPDGGVAGIDLGATTIAFDADCGTTPAAQTITFHNTGTLTLSWSATIAGDGFTVTDPSGTVLPGATGSFTIAATVPATAIAGHPITATLSVATNALAAPIAIPLTLTPHGGALTVGTPTIGFGQIQLTSTVAQDVVVTNTGDRAIQIELGAATDGDFTATWDTGPTAADVEPGASLVGAIAHFRPTTAGTATDSVPIVVTGALCAGDPATIAVAGEGTTASVDITPGTVPFGATACGATAGSQLVTIQNDYNFAITYTASIASGPYTIAAGQATGTVPANGSTTISVKANAVPKATASLAANALAGHMTVTTTAPSATPADITLAQTATGAVLATTPAGGSTIAFGDVANGTPSSLPFSIANTGNVAATITVAATGSGFTATTPGAGTIPANGTSVGGTVTETVAARGSHTGSLAISTTTALCQPAAPTAIALSTVGLASVASIGGAPAMVSTCGVATPPTANVTITNTGDEPLVIASASATGGFAVTTALPLTIAIGSAGTLAVRPPAAVVGTDAAGASKTGNLSFTTNEIGAPTHVVALASTVTGAVLALTPVPGTTIDFGNVDVGSPVGKSFSVTNTGNLAATVTAAVTGSGYTVTQPNGGAIPATGVAQSGTITQTVTAHGTTAGTLGIASTTAQCAAVPGGDSLTAFDRTPVATVGTASAMSATCGGSTPTAVSVSIQNTGDGPLVISSATATGGFVVTTTLPITIAAGSSSSVSVRPAAAVIGTDVGGATKTGTLTLVTNELTGNSHAVALSSTTIGANLSLADGAGAPIMSASFSTSGNCPGGQTIFVKNTGNAPATVSITTPNQQGFQWFGFSPSPTIAGGGQASHFLGLWTLNDDKCVQNETIQYTATGSICTALPVALQASAMIGTGTSCFCS